MSSSEIIALPSSSSQIVGSINATNEIASSASPLSPPVVNLDVPKPRHKGWSLSSASSTQSNALVLLISHTHTRSLGKTIGMCWSCPCLSSGGNSSSDCIRSLKETSQAPPSINEPLDHCATVSSDQPPSINIESRLRRLLKLCHQCLPDYSRTNCDPKDCSGISEQVLGSNRFASLISSEGDEEDLSGSNIETSSMDLMTPFGKRILRERPVKPSTKARDAHLQLTGRGRGNRGRGNRGRSG
ncbi:hypothetical protein Bca4012_081521 [Brassica carinata]